MKRNNTRKRWSVRHLRALKTQKMYLGGEVKGQGPVVGRVTQCQRLGQLKGLGVERIRVYRWKTTQPHRHFKSEAFLMVLKGQGDIVLNGRVVAVKEGYVIFIPPKTIHGFVTQGDQLEFIAIQRPALYQPGKNEDLEIVE